MSQFISPVRRARAIVLAGLVFCLAAPRGAAAQIEVDHFEVFLRPGSGTASSPGTFTVKNVSDKEITTQLNIGDWERSIDGTNQYSDTVGKMTGSCQATITVFPTILRLAPQQSQAVTVSYTGAPRTSSCWSIIFVGTAPQPANLASGAQVTVELRQGVKIYVEPPGGRPELQIDSVDTSPRHVPVTGEAPTDTIGPDITALVRNPGVIQSRVKGRVEYRTLRDSLVTTRTIQEFPILPGALREVRSRMPRLPAGQYVALVILDFGGSELVAAQIELDVR